MMQDPSKNYSIRSKPLKAIGPRELAYFPRPRCLCNPYAMILLYDKWFLTASALHLRPHALWIYAEFEHVWVFSQLIATIAWPVDLFPLEIVYTVGLLNKLMFKERYALEPTI